MRERQVPLCEQSKCGGSAAVSSGGGKIHGGDGDGDEVPGAGDKDCSEVPMEWRRWIDGCGGAGVVINDGDMSESGGGSGRGP